MINTHYTNLHRSKVLSRSNMCAIIILPYHTLIGWNSKGLKLLRHSVTHKFKDNIPTSSDENTEILLSCVRRPWESQEWLTSILELAKNVVRNWYLFYEIIPDISGEIISPEPQVIIHEPIQCWHVSQLLLKDILHIKKGHLSMRMVSAVNCVNTKPCRTRSGGISCSCVPIKSYSTLGIECCLNSN